MNALELCLLRDPVQPIPSTTLGRLFVDDEYFCETLEDELREIDGVPVTYWKVPKKTAIPRGRYEVTIDMSRRFGRLMLHILDVEGFDGIRVHGANTHLNVEGCVGVGETRTETGIALCAKVLARLERRVSLALSAGKQVFIEVK